MQNFPYRVRKRKFLLEFILENVKASTYSIELLSLEIAQYQRAFIAQRFFP